jgi:hypothetical protein
MIEYEDIIEDIPTELLMAELQRRGLTVTDPLEFSSLDELN